MPSKVLFARSVSCASASAFGVLSMPCAVAVSERVSSESVKCGDRLAGGRGGRVSLGGGMLRRRCGCRREIGERCRRQAHVVGRKVKCTGCEGGEPFGDFALAMVAWHCVAPSAGRTGREGQSFRGVRRGDTTRLSKG